MVMHPLAKYEFAKGASAGRFERSVTVSSSIEAQWSFRWALSPLMGFENLVALRALETLWIGCSFWVFSVV